MNITTVQPFTRFNVADDGTPLPVRPDSGCVRKADSRRGFTLIEMLVVIAIIAILVSILAPTISGALERAKRIKCASRQRSTYIAIASYLADHNGKIHLYSSYTENASWGRELFLKGYTQNEQTTLVCPTAFPARYDPDMDSVVPNDPDASEFNSFGMCFPGFGTWIQVPQWPEFMVSPLYSPKPSQQFFLGDTTRLSSEGGRAEDIYVFWNGEGVLHLRHAGKANVTFADGHLQAVGKEEIRAFAEDIRKAPHAFSQNFNPQYMDKKGRIRSAL